jgi:hypothetical protein
MRETFRTYFAAINSAVYWSGISGVNMLSPDYSRNAPPERLMHSNLAVKKKFSDIHVGHHYVSLNNFSFAIIFSTLSIQG